MTEGDLCVARVPIFQGLTREEQLHVAEFVRPKTAHAGDIVHSPGQLVSTMLVMHSGQLKVSHTSAGGQEQILRTVRDGDVVGDRAFLTGDRSTDLVVAVEDSRMCALDHAHFSDLLREYPDIGLRMLRTQAHQLSSVERLLGAITSHDVTARVAAYLLDQPATVRDGVRTVRLPIAKKDVAAYLGTTPETLSRRLAALAGRGVIGLPGRRDVTIPDVDALVRAAEPDEQIRAQRSPRGSRRSTGT